MKKSEAQASAVTQTAEFPETASSTAGSPRGELRSMCARMTDEEEMAKFDGDTIRKETVFRNVSIVNNFEGDIRRILARREQEPCHSHG